jgi:hypothetical protein
MEFVFNVAAFGLIRRNIGVTRLLLACSQVPIHLLAERAIFPNEGVAGRKGGNAFDERNWITRGTEAKIVDKTGTVDAARYEPSP